MALDKDEPAAIPPSPSHTRQQLTFSSCIKKCCPNNIPHLLSPEQQEEEPQRTTTHRKCDCDASHELAQKQVQYISQTCKGTSDEVRILAKANKTNRRLANATANKSVICKSNRIATTTASCKSNCNDALAMRCKHGDSGCTGTGGLPWLGQHKIGQ